MKREKSERGGFYTFGRGTLNEIPCGWDEFDVVTCGGVMGIRNGVRWGIRAD